MLDYIERNKEWIFSGVGIAIIVAIYKLMSSLMLKKGPKPLKEPPHIAEHTIRQTTSPVRGLTVEGIIDQIQSAPPYQKEAIAKNFEGIHVKWEGKIWDIGKPLFGEPGSNDVVVEVHPGESIRQIRFTVSVDKYPELKVLKRGDQIGVSGTIKACSGPGVYVELDVVEITFPK